MRQLLLLLPIFLATFACQAESPTGTAASKTSGEPDLGKVLAIECSDLNFVADIRENEAWLYLPDYTGSLPQVPSASGNKYQADNITLWLKGSEAMFDYGAKSYKGCRNNPMQAVWEAAKLRGIDFMALGNEPAWKLEIQGDTLMLETDYGKQHSSFENAKQTTDSATGSTVYSANKGGDTPVILVTVENKTCADSMVERTYANTVTVQTGERLFRGCGQALD